MLNPTKKIYGHKIKKILFVLIYVVIEGKHRRSWPGGRRKFIESLDLMIYLPDLFLKVTNITAPTTTIMAVETPKTTPQAEESPSCLSEICKSNQNNQIDNLPSCFSELCKSNQINQIDYLTIDCIMNWCLEIMIYILLHDI